VKGALLGLVLMSASLVTATATTARAQATTDREKDLREAQELFDRGATDTNWDGGMARDCTMACRGLESMKRAAEKLCTLDPGERCVKVKQELEGASARVRSACPACAEALDVQRPVAPQPPMAAPRDQVAAAESVPSRGGCAGCASATGPADAVSPVALAGLAVLAMRRRRR